MEKVDNIYVEKVRQVNVYSLMGQTQILQQP